MRRRSPVPAKFQKGDRFAQVGTFAPFFRVIRVFKEKGTWRYMLKNEKTQKAAFSEDSMQKIFYKLSARPCRRARLRPVR
jgi:hypothetical protein